VNAVPSVAFHESRRKVLLGELVKGQREETMREPDFHIAVLGFHREPSAPFLPLVTLRISHCCQSGAESSCQLS